MTRGRAKKSPGGVSVHLLVPGSLCENLELVSDLEPSMKWLPSTPVLAPLKTFSRTTKLDAAA